MVDRIYYKMNYFKEAVCFDPVNYYLLLEKEDLTELKQKLSPKDIQEIVQKLESIHVNYRQEQISVVNKPTHFLGFDPKDYVSLATYYWPNPNTKDGLPYISRDGEANPEGKKFDKDKLRQLAFITYYQGILYFLTEDKKYYLSLKDNLTYFFLDEITGMNPNLNHAQMILGKNLGRGIGIIDFTANFTYPLRLLKILNDLGYIEEEFHSALKSWIEKLALWLEESPLGLEEKYARNNHGIFYDLGLATIYDFLEEDKKILPLIYQMIEFRLEEEIASDGSMPKETARTKSKNYSLMAIKGVYDFNTLIREYGYDLYHLEDWYYRKTNINLKKSLEFLLDRLVTKKVSWEFEQIIPFDEATLIPLLVESRKQFLNIHFDMIKKLTMKFDILKMFL